MSNNEEDMREGSDGETAGDGSTQPRDPETGRFLPSDATVGSESDAEQTTEREDRAADRTRDRAKQASGGGSKQRRTLTERQRSTGRGSRGVVTLGQPPADAGGPTRRTPESQPVILHLRRADATEERSSAAIVPPEVLQTSAEREYPPWLAKPPESEVESDRLDDEREFWEAPVDLRDEGADLSQGRRGLERLQPERRATRQSTDAPGGSPQPWDGEPRQQPGTDRAAGFVQPTGMPPFLLPSRPDAVVPALARRHQIGRWLQRGRVPIESELPPHRRPIADQQGASGPRDGVDRYAEPQEVRVGPTPPQHHEQWEYATSRSDRPSERWEAAWGDDEPRPNERGQRGVAHARAERHAERGGGPPQSEPGRSARGGRDDDTDEAIRPGPT